MSDDESQTEINYPFTFNAFLNNIYFIAHKFNNCDNPVTVTTTMDISKLDITWTYTFTSDDIIKVPGFTVSLPPILFAGVYVQVGLKKDEEKTAPRGKCFFF